MAVITVPDSVRTFLTNLSERAELRDAEGQLIGTFLPKHVLEELLYERADRELDPEEVRRNLREQKGGFSIEEVRARLQSMENS